MQILRQIVGFIAVVSLGGLLGTAFYETVVLAPNFNSDIPNSLEHFRLFLRVATPASFFRVWAPAAQIALVVCVISTWKSRSARYCYLAALVCLVAVDLVTFGFHYPRNDLLFRAPLTQPVPQLVTAAREWAAGNFGRIALLLLSTVAASLGLRTSILWRSQIS